MKRVRQLTSSHCGPAALEMLLSFLGVYLDQEKLVEAAEAGSKLEEYGMTVGEMGLAVKRLAPQLAFWFKTNSSLAEISQIIKNYGFPVGVEWQGVFYEDADDDNGHYGVVTHIDTINNIIVVSDPYKRFAGTDRQFHVLEFQDRWWDENEIRDPVTGRVDLVRDERMVFVITPGDCSWPESLGMARG